MTALLNESCLATQTKPPILYSFRRCPYAMRARMAMMYSGVVCELREVLLKDKPQAMLDISAKGTVPVLQLTDKVIDESVDVMRWALRQNDPKGWNHDELSSDLLKRNDGEFKSHLDHYKYFERFPEEEQVVYFERALAFIDTLESNMITNPSGEHYLLSPDLSAIDVAIFPFVRQFAHVDRNAFERLPFAKVKSWLASRLESALFSSVMPKYPIWQPDQKIQLFGAGIDMN